jgi:hypothetical protein
MYIDRYLHNFPPSGTARKINRAAEGSRFQLKPKRETVGILASPIVSRFVTAEHQ